MCPVGVTVTTVSGLHATPIGEVIVAAPTYKRLIAEFTGQEAHAGINPEDGHSAIEAASVAVAAMERTAPPSTTPAPWTRPRPASTSPTCCIGR